MFVMRAVSNLHSPWAAVCQASVIRPAGYFYSLFVILLPANNCTLYRSTRRYCFLICLELALQLHDICRLGLGESGWIVLVAIELERDNFWGQTVWLLSFCEIFLSHHFYCISKDD